MNIRQKCSGTVQNRVAFGFRVVMFTILVDVSVVAVYLGQPQLYEYLFQNLKLMKKTK